MEKWQRQHIQGNLVELIKSTDCGAHLISKLIEAQVIGRGDKEMLERPRLTPMEKSKLLYEILQTRTGSYDILIQSLVETDQSGALQILKEHGTKYRYYGCISYDTNHVLGKGCFGTKVFKGRFGERDVAVKVVNIEITDPENALREIEFLKQLDCHENIVRYYTAETKDNLILIALELCIINLQDEIKMNLLHMEPTEILIQCTRGVAHLHNNNVIHRDLQPANILLNDNGQVKISDFGLSQQIPIGATSVSIDSGAAGTAEWMAPEILETMSEDEQSTGSLKMTTAVDIFSLGCIFYFVLASGTHPFGDSIDRQYNIRYDKPQMKKSLVKVPWLHLIENMISHFPKQRQSAPIILEADCFYNQSSTNFKRHSYTLTEIEPKVENEMKRKSVDCAEEAGKETKSPPPSNRLSADTIFSTFATLSGSLSPILSRTKARAVSVGEALHDLNENFSFKAEKLEGSLDFLSMRPKSVPVPSSLPTMPPKPSFRNPIPEVSMYLENSLKSNEILVICTSDVDICISRIQNTITAELPVVEVNIFDKIDNARKFIHPISIAKVNLFGREELEIIKSTDKKVLVVTHDVLTGVKGIKRVDDVMSWVDLSVSYQNELVKILLSYPDEDPDLLKLLGESMCEFPDIYKTLLNEDLVYLLDNKINSKLVSVLVKCFLESHINTYSEKTGIPIKDIIFGLASVSNDINMKQLAPLPLLNHFYQYTAIKGYSFFVDKEILSVDMPNLGENDEKFRFRAFKDYFTAQIISKCHLLSRNDEIIKTYLIKDIYYKAGHCTDFKNSRIVQFHDSITFEKRALVTILNVIKHEARFFEACISGGHFDLLQQILQVSPAVFKPFKVALNCRMPQGKLWAVDQFMSIHSKCLIRVIFENYELRRLASSDSSVYTTPLHEIILRNDFSLFELLLRKHGYQQIISKNKIIRLVHFCVMDTKNLNDDLVIGRLKIVHVLANVNPLYLKTDRSKGTWPPLSVPNIHVTLVKYLIKAGVTLFDLDDNKSNIAHTAATYMSLSNFQELVGLLVEEGFELAFRLKNKYDEIPLFNACRHIHLDEASFEHLLSISGNDVDCKGYGSQSLLHTTAVSGNLEILNTVLRKGVDVNVTDELGDSCLHYVLREGRKNCFEIVNLLIANNINVNAGNVKGVRPLGLAMARCSHDQTGNSNEYQKIVWLLKKAGAH